MEKEPNWIEKVFGTLFNPGGHPDDIRRARDTCHELSNRLNFTLNDMEATTGRLTKDWTGRSSEALAKTLSKFVVDLREYAKKLNEAGSGLEELAEYIEEAQRQAKIFMITIAATLAAGAAFTIFTAGLSNAASMAAASAQVSGLASLGVRMAFVISSRAVAMGVIQSAMASVAARMALALAFSWASSAFVKGVVQDLNILEPDSWNASDGNKILLDGILVAGFSTLARLPRIATRLAGPTGVPSLGRELAGGMVFGATASATFSFISQFGFHGKSITEGGAWTEVAASTGVGGLAGFGAAGLFSGAPRVLKTLRPGNGNGTKVTIIKSTSMVDLKAVDVMRATTGMVSDAINYIINYPEVKGQPGISVPGTAQTLQDVPVPTPDAGTGHPPLPTLGGGTHTVAKGQSLSSIAGQVYGDPNLWPRIADANPQITDPSRIRPGDVIKLPALQLAPR